MIDETAEHDAELSAALRYFLARTSSRSASIRFVEPGEQDAGEPSIFPDIPLSESGSCRKRAAGAALG